MGAREFTDWEEQNPQGLWGASPVDKLKTIGLIVGRPGLDVRAQDQALTDRGAASFCKIPH
jgi:hypothetical protein